MIIQENLVENDKELLLMKTAFSDEFMEKVLKEYTKKEDWFLHAPCCIHGYYDYYNKAEACKDISLLLSREHYILLGEDWGEYVLLYKEEKQIYYCAFVESVKDNLYKCKILRLSFEEIFEKVGYMKSSEEKRIQVRSMKKNKDYKIKRGLRAWFGF